MAKSNIWIIIIILIVAFFIFTKIKAEEEEPMIEVKFYDENKNLVHIMDSAFAIVQDIPNVFYATFTILIENIGDQELVDLQITEATITPDVSPPKQPEFWNVLPTGGGGAPITYSDSFETDFGNWNNVIGDDFDWTRHTGATSSTGTGPTSAQCDSYYVYTESSSPNYPAKTAIMESLVLDMTNNDFTIDFYYHAYGSSPGYLYLEIDEGVWTEIWSTAITSTNAWVYHSEDLSGYSGNRKLRFRVVTGSSFTNDFALDCINIVSSGGGLTAGVGDTVSFGESGFLGLEEFEGTDQRFSVTVTGNYFAPGIGYIPMSKSGYVDLTIKPDPGGANFLVDVGSTGSSSAGPCGGKICDGITEGCSSPIGAEGYCCAGFTKVYDAYCDTLTGTCKYSTYENSEDCGFVNLCYGPDGTGGTADDVDCSDACCAPDEPNPRPSCTVGTTLYYLGECDPATGNCVYYGTEHESKHCGGVTCDDFVCNSYCEVNGNPALGIDPVPGAKGYFYNGYCDPSIVECVYEYDSNYPYAGCGGTHYCTPLSCSSGWTDGGISCTSINCQRTCSRQLCGSSWSEIFSGSDSGSDNDGSCYSAVGYTLPTTTAYCYHFDVDSSHDWDCGALPVGEWGYRKKATLEDFNLGIDIALKEKYYCTYNYESSCGYYPSFSVEGYCAPTLDTCGVFSDCVTDCYGHEIIGRAYTRAYTDCSYDDRAQIDVWVDMDFDIYRASVQTSYDNKQCTDPIL